MLTIIAAVGPYCLASSTWYTVFLALFLEKTKSSCPPKTVYCALVLLEEKVKKSWVYSAFRST